MIQNLLDLGAGEQRQVLKVLVDVVLGMWVFACLQHLWALTFANGWPIVLIELGLQMLLRGWAIAASHAARPNAYRQVLQCWAVVFMLIGVMKLSHTRHTSGYFGVDALPDCPENGVGASASICTGLV